MKIVCYSLKSLTQARKAKLNRELRGFEDRSNHGAYTYRRKGLLSGIKSRTVYLAGIVVDDRHAERIVALLRRHKARVYVMSAARMP